MQNSSGYEDRVGKILKLSSSAFAVAGGILLAANLEVSKYGFVILALGSAQMLFAGLRTGDKLLTLYAGSIFVFVDCLGIYRWVFK
jgi:hypothetical protein